MGEGEGGRERGKKMTVFCCIFGVCFVWKISGANERQRYIMTDLLT